MLPGWRVRRWRRRRAMSFVLLLLVLLLVFAVLLRRTEVPRLGVESFGEIRAELRFEQGEARVQVA